MKVCGCFPHLQTQADKADISPQILQFWEGHVAVPAWCWCLCHPFCQQKHAAEVAACLGEATAASRGPCPPSARFPAATPSPQPPPAPWLQKPAQVQPTLATRGVEMSQPPGLRKMTQAQLTRAHRAHGVGERQKIMLCE